MLKKIIQIKQNKIMIMCLKDLEILQILMILINNLFNDNNNLKLLNKVYFYNLPNYLLAQIQENDDNDDGLNLFDDGPDDDNNDKNDENDNDLLDS